MAKILYFQPGCEPELYEHENLATWMLEQWPVGSIRPRGLKLYINSVTEDNDITNLWRKDPDCVMKNDADYIVVELPRGPAAVFVPYIIAAIVAVAAVLILSPGASGTALAGSNNRISSNNDLQGRSNSPRAGSRIADIRGYVRSYPDLLMNYKLFIERTEYEVQFLCVGTGEYLLEDILDGITPAENISGEKLSFYKNGNAPGAGQPYLKIGGDIDLNNFPIVIAKSSNEADGAELKPSNYADVTKASFDVYSTGQLTSYISSTPDTVIDWSDFVPAGGNINLVDFYSFTPNSSPANTFKRNDLSGSYTVVSAGENILIVNTSGRPGWSYFSPAGQNAITQAYLRSDGNWEFTNSGSSTLVKFSPSVNSPTPYAVGPYLLKNADKIMVNLYAQSGIYKTNGDVYPFTVAFDVILEDPTGSRPSVVYPMYVAGRYTEAVGNTLIVNNPFTGPVNVYVRRTDYTDKNFEGTVVDSVKWRDLYAISDITPRSYGDVTLVHSVTKATNSALKQKERKLNMLATRIYNGVASRNFADVIMSMHTDPFFGRRDETTIDVESLYETQQQILDYFGDIRSIEVGYTFDNQDTTYEEALQIICSSVNVTPYQIGSVLYFWPELPQNTSTMQFGHAFKVPDSDKRTRSFSPPKDYTGVQVKYFDHTEKSYLYINKGEPTNLYKIELLSCQSPWLANVRANREYNKLRYQRVTHDCTTLSIGLQASPGMRVDMIDNTRNMQMEGVITDVDGLKLTLSDPVQFVAGNNYTITLTHTLGDLENIPVSAGENDFEVVMSYYPSEDIYTGWLRDRTSYVIRSDDSRTKLAMLVQSMQPSGKDNNYQVDLTCINYDARYYQDDLSGAE